MKQPRNLGKIETYMDSDGSHLDEVSEAAHLLDTLGAGEARLGGGEGRGEGEGEEDGGLHGD